jgi:hypothetical protein
MRTHDNEVNDFAAPYIGARLLSEGKNPYAPDNFRQEWLRAGGSAEALKSAPTTNTHPAYPLSTYAIMLPFRFLDWKSAIRALEYVSILGLGVVGLLAAKATPPNWTDRTLVLLSVLLLAPFHTCFGTSNISLLAVEAIAAAALLSSDGGRGVLLAIALCIKPQLAIFPFCWWLLLSNWTVIGIASVGLVAAISSATLALRNVSWSADFSRNLAMFFSPGSPNDSGLQNPSRFELLNFQVIGHSIGLNDLASNTLAITLALTLAALVWAAYRRNSEFAGITAMTLISLLPVYQRFYNAGVVLLFVVFCLQQRRKEGLFLVVAFLAPVGAAMRACFGLPSHTVLAIFAYSLDTWVLVAMIIFLVYQPRHENISEVSENPESSLAEALAS